MKNLKVGLIDECDIDGCSSGRPSTEVRAQGQEGNSIGIRDNRSIGIDDMNINHRKR